MHTRRDRMVFLPFSSPSSPTRFSGSRHCAPTSSSVQRSAGLCFHWWSEIPATEPELWEHTQTHVSPRPALGYEPKHTCGHGDVTDVLSVNQSFGYYRTELRGASLQRYFSHENALRGELKQKWSVTQAQREENQTLKVDLCNFGLCCTAADHHVPPVYGGTSLSAECAETIV